MNELRALIEETAEHIFRDHCTKEAVDAAESGAFPDELWTHLTEAGLHRAGIPEEFGGAGGDAGDALALIRIAARYAAPVPFAEGFIAAHVLASAGRAVPEGRLTVAIAGDGVKLENGVLQGEFPRVPWGATCEHVLCCVPGSPARCALVQPEAAQIAEGRNLAGEPRDTLIFEGVPAEAYECEDALRLGALCRSVQIAAALERVMDLTVEHVNVRVQFGRPIASFQAVRQQIAVMAAQTAAAQMAADTAVRAFESDGNAARAIAVAKARCGEAAGIVAPAGHQMLGAMGMTYEHALHQYTRRVWAWQNEFGAERFWQRKIGAALCAAGPEKLWEGIAG